MHHFLADGYYMCFCRMIRSLAFAAQHFGLTPPGSWHCSLPGSHLLDGTAFVRAAGLLLDSLGWEHEGEEAGSWDRKVIGLDEAWEDAERDPSYEAPDGQRARGNGFAFGNGTPDYPKHVDKGKGRATEQ